MNNFSFKDYLEWADFGLDKLPRGKIIENPDDVLPMKPLNIEYVCEQIGKYKLGLKESTDQFFGEMQWGDGPGAVKLSFGPYRGLRVVIKHLTTNLHGEATWVCKKVLEVRNFYDKNEDTLAQKLIKLLEEVDKQGIESPKNDYENLENLVSYMASSLRRNTSQRIFTFEGIRRLTDNKHYIIHFGCMGAGLQRQGQKRLDQLHIEVKYESGLIKICCNEIGDSVKSHKWKIDPSQFIEYYSPAQSKEEIVGTVVSLLNSY